MLNDSKDTGENKGYELTDTPRDNILLELLIVDKNLCWQLNFFAFYQEPVKSQVMLIAQTEISWNGVSL